ncbi:hypothetical protein P7K49_016515 [Saguinus oedipus]|uniref:Uncharacterized protein n=1 Tax=Saguinus oedipus TaxID=9490 RepID=A0ABQ9VCV2_SAGOE|nr:hypothetical protein P7K49_016515 [Saguinus oedipus]
MRTDTLGGILEGEEGTPGQLLSSAHLGSEANSQRRPASSRLSAPASPRAPLDPARPFPRTPVRGSPQPLPLGAAPRTSRTLNVKSQALAWATPTQSHNLHGRSERHLPTLTKALHPASRTRTPAPHLRPPPPPPPRAGARSAATDTATTTTQLPPPLQLPPRPRLPPAPPPGAQPLGPRARGGGASDRGRWGRLLAGSRNAAVSCARLMLSQHRARGRVGNPFGLQRSRRNDLEEKSPHATSRR